MLRSLSSFLQQGRSRNAANNNLVGLSVEITLAVKNSDGATTSDRIKIILPGSLDTNTPNIQTVSSNYVNDTGLILRSANHNIPAPPSIHVPVDVEGLAASIRFEIDDRQA